ncbi:unnamed protein product [Musa textilis]
MCVVVCVYVVCSLCVKLCVYMLCMLCVCCVYSLYCIFCVCIVCVVFVCVYPIDQAIGQTCQSVSGHPINQSISQLVSDQPVTLDRSIDQPVIGQSVIGQSVVGQTNQSIN